MEIASILADTRIVDLSVPISEEWPAVWPQNPDLEVSRLHWFDEEAGHFNRLLQLDEHIGTHWDAPAHFIPPPDGETNDQIPLERFVVAASCIDATDLLDAGRPGWSPKVDADRVRAWEREHGELGAGSGVLLHTGWSDRNYQPLPAGRAYAHEVAEGEGPGWPAIDAEAMQLLVDRGVVLFGTDTPSAGPLDDLAAPHAVGLGAGVVLVENLIGLGQMPAHGALFAFLPLKLLGGSGAPGRAIGLVFGGAR